jgi:hypothetical protein
MSLGNRQPGQNAAGEYPTVTHHPSFGWSSFSFLLSTVELSSVSTLELLVTLDMDNDMLIPPFSSVYEFEATENQNVKI